MTEDELSQRLRAFLVERRPDLDGDIEPDTQLWQAGYLDSFGLIEVIGLLEELTGAPVQVGADDLPSFFTLKGMVTRFAASRGRPSGLAGTTGRGGMSGSRT